jgi:transposase
VRSVRSATCRGPDAHRRLLRRPGAWLRGEACVKPKERGYPHELWTRRLLAEHARDHGVAAGHASLVRLAPSTVCTILNAPAIKPHKVRYYLERRDPAFERRMAEVIEVYGAAEMVRGLAPNERPVAIVSYDEKPGIQAIATTAPELEPKPDKHPTVQRDHEYKRLGTVTLAAAVDLVTGIVHHAVTQRHRSREFVAFLQMLDAAYPLGILICVLLDNHSAHKSKETRGFLALHPGRFELVFTPTHASWLNYVETYFSKMARSVLRQIRVASKEELASRMRQYIQTADQRPVVPKWASRINHDPQLVAA